jgi:segregation and condensation protein A
MAYPPSPDVTTLSDYQLRLPAFEGPLDILLRLIERDRLPITDISLVAVTDQFVAYLRTMSHVEPTVIAEFAAVAGRLVLLKSRSLLPRPSTPEEHAPNDLVRQLIEYRTLRAAIDHLAGREHAARGSFARTAAIGAPDAPPPRLVATEIGALARALRRRLTSLPDPITVVATRPVITLREMAERVLQALAMRPRVTFATLVHDRADRHEVLVAFLAVLVLVRRQVVVAEQVDIFGQITLSQVVPATDGATLAADD